MPRKVLIPLLAVMTAAGLLSGCEYDIAEPAQGQAAPSPTTQPDLPEVLDRKYGSYFDHGMTPFETRVRLSDGREVLCLGYSQYGAAGWSCDWANATTPTTPPTEEAK